MSGSTIMVKNYFKSKHSHVSEYFVECCLGWVLQEFIGISEKELCEKVYEQWLSTDLKEIGERSLPTNLCKEKNKIIEGNYVVQIMYLKDISKSSFVQLKQIRNMFNSTSSIIEKENEAPGKRVLYFQGTDGVQDIFAFEYETVQCLNLNLTPGIKVLLSGPLTIRNGEILLKNNNVKILGGEVEELLVSNAAENVLARELNLPENPNPGKVECQVPTNNTQNTVSQKKPTIENIPVMISNPTSTRNNQQNDIFDDDDFLLAQLSVPDEYENVRGEINNEVIDNEFKDFEINEQLDLENENAYPVIVSGEPFYYIKQMLDNREQVVGKTVKVKGQFIEVVQKLSFSSSRGWTMKCKIVDGTGILVVDFLSVVLEELFGVTFEQALVLKEKVKNKVAEACERIAELIIGCRDQLTRLNCFMGLRLNGQTEIATVMWLKPVLPRDLLKLKQRVDSFRHGINY